MPLIIGLGYRANHGKDTAAQAILGARGDAYDIRIYPFAKALKLEVYGALFNPTDPFWPFLETLTKATMSPLFYWSVLIPKPTIAFAPDEEKLAWIEAHKDALRKILQIYGSEYRRAQDPFYWVRETGNKIKADDPQIALITDMRMMNEAFFVKANDGWTVNVVRDGFVNSGAAGHQTEQQLANYDFDYTITVPEGNLDELRSNAVEVFDDIISTITPPDLSTEDFLEDSFGTAA